MGPVASWELSRPKLAAAIPPSFDGRRRRSPASSASDKDGLPTTLGRNGSDYSASIFGALLDADEVHIWTDVDGVMSGDPRQVPEAKIIDEMSYSEAMELAYFGAKVIHPQTMAPAVGRGIPLWIRNTFNATHPGTKISASSGSRAAAVKGISGVDKVALVNLEGAGMIGVPGHGRSAVRRSARRRRLGHADLAGQLRALDLLRRARGSRRPGAHGRRARVRRRAQRRAGAARRRHEGLRHHRRRRRRHGGHAGQRGPVLRHARQRRHQRARDRAGSVRAQHLGRHRRQGHDARDPRRPLAASICRRRRSRSACSGPGSSAARCSTSSRAPLRRCARSSTSTCACARSAAARRCCSTSSASISPSGASRSRRASRWTPTSSSRTSRPTICRTPCSSTARRTRASRIATPSGCSAAFTSSRRTSAPTAGRSRTTRT